MAKKVNFNKDKEKYHFDEALNSFYSSDNMPFDSKIHPGLRHLHKSASFLKCSHCGRITTSGMINSECNFTQPNGSICSGLLLGNLDF